MKKLMVASFAILFLAGNLFAQTDLTRVEGMRNIRKNVFYVEILGYGAVYSINYERMVPLSDRLAIFFRAGANEYHADSTTELSFNFIGATGILYGKSKHYFEAGAGYTWFMGPPDRLISFSAGYRFQGLKGLIIRLTPMYIVNTQKGDVFGNSFWGGFSIGYSF